MLEGIIEMDEAYLGAPKRGKKRGRGTERKKMAVAEALGYKGNGWRRRIQDAGHS